MAPFLDACQFSSGGAADNEEYFADESPSPTIMRRPGIIVSRNEEFIIATLLMFEAAVLWEILRTAMVLFCHWMVGVFAPSPKGD
jgi:hypothetical protein